VQFTEKNQKRKNNKKTGISAFLKMNRGCLLILPLSFVFNLFLKSDICSFQCTSCPLQAVSFAFAFVLGLLLLTAS